MEPFYFYTRITQELLLGRKAKNIKELRSGIDTVPRQSIYHHTHRYLEQHQTLSPESPNDFSYWVTCNLGLRKLGEMIASIDIFRFPNLDDLRQAFIDVLDHYLASTPQVRNCIPGEEFYFMSSRIFVLPTPLVAFTPAEFLDGLNNVTIHSLYYHMFEARLRLKRGDNDFSHWLRKAGYARLAERISRIDPYTFTVQGLRKEIIRMVQAELSTREEAHSAVAEG